MRLSELLICAIFLTSCAGQSMDQDGGDLTRGEVEYLSSRMMVAIESEFPLLQHKLVNSYVNLLGQSIVARNPKMPPLPYEFRVLKSNEVFVFSLPGGIVYVTLGVLRAVELEGQLAAAMAHELAHQQYGHPLIQWRRRINARRDHREALTFAGDWKDEFLGERGALFLPQEMEEEADTLAPVILYRARFDPRVYASYLTLLKKLQVKEPKNVETMLSLHPNLVERQRWAKEGMMRLPPKKDPNVSSQTFQRIKSILQEAAKAAKKEGNVE